MISLENMTPDFKLAYMEAKNSGKEIVKFGQVFNNRIVYFAFKPNGEIYRRTFIADEDDIIKTVFGDEKYVMSGIIQERIISGYIENKLIYKDPCKDPFGEYYTDHIYLKFKNDSHRKVFYDWLINVLSDNETLSEQNLRNDILWCTYPIEANLITNRENYGWNKDDIHRISEIEKEIRLPLPHMLETNCCEKKLHNA